MRFTIIEGKPYVLMSEPHYTSRIYIGREHDQIVVNYLYSPPKISPIL